MSHLSKDEMERLNASLAQIGLKEALRHLLLCTPCRKRAAALQLLDEEETWEELPVAFSDRVLHRAVSVLEKRYTRSCEEHAAAGPLCDELLAQPRASRVRAVHTDPRFLSAAVAERLVDAAAGCCQADPAAAADRAELALAIGGKLPAPGGTERAVLLVRAGVWVGEARRALG